MTLELNKPYLVKRVANNGGTLHFVPHDGLCDGVVLGKPVLAQRVALKDGTLHFLMSDQKLDDDGKLILGKPYLAKRVAVKDGKLHFVVSGKRCSEPPDSITVCECEAVGGLCLTVEGTAWDLDTPTGVLPFEGDYALEETTWAEVAGIVEYNVVCDNSFVDPESPDTISDDWYTGAESLLGDYSSLRWFWTEWRSDPYGLFRGGTDRVADGKPVEWRHVVAINESGCTVGIYTIYKEDGGHTIVRDWCNLAASSIFYYNLDQETDVGICITSTSVIGRGSGSCGTPSFSCDPWLYEKSTHGTWPEFWDAGTNDSYVTTDAEWSIYACGA